jgi:hypothetical protein
MLYRCSITFAFNTQNFEVSAGALLVITIESGANTSTVIICQLDLFSWGQEPVAALVSTVMNFWCSLKVEIALPTEKLTPAFWSYIIEDLYTKCRILPLIILK